MASEHNNTDNSKNNDSYHLHSSKRKYFHLLVALLQTLLCSGVVYGWPSLVQILEAENVYVELCDPDEVRIGGVVMNLEKHARS